MAKKQPERSSKSTNESSLTPNQMKTAEIRDLIEFISQTGLNEVNLSLIHI